MAKQSATKEAMGKTPKKERGWLFAVRVGTLAVVSGIMGGITGALLGAIGGAVVGLIGGPLGVVGGAIFGATIGAGIGGGLFALGTVVTALGDKEKFANLFAEVKRTAQGQTPRLEPEQQGSKPPLTIHTQPKVSATDPATVKTEAQSKDEMREDPKSSSGQEKWPGKKL